MRRINKVINKKILSGAIAAALLMTSNAFAVQPGGVYAGIQYASFDATVEKRNKIPASHCLTINIEFNPTNSRIIVINTDNVCLGLIIFSSY